MEYVVYVNNLTKDYGAFHAVKGITFQVEKGEIFGFLGPNGAGKTSTIRMLTGLSQPTGGEAKVLGHNVYNDITEAKKSIGVVPELSNLYDELSAYDNLIFMAELYGVPREERRKRAEHLLRTFGLYDRKDSLFGTFSRGMKRAMTIAAALIHEPQIIFLDEPTVGLDVMAARSLRKIISDLKKRDISIFLTTHYLEEADILCDRIALLVKGKIAASGTPDELKKSCLKEPVIQVDFSSDKIGDLIDALPDVKVDIRDTRARIIGNSPDIYSLITAYADRKKIGIAAINTLNPTLEDAFIKLTGISSTDMVQDNNGK